MKIDKSNPLHWFFLMLFSINVVLAVLIRKFVSSNGNVLLYGHKFNGNLAAIYRESKRYRELNLSYLTMDYFYYRKLRREGVSVVWAGSPLALKLLITARVLISDHGLHPLVLLLDHSSLKFIDVWHGIPFKGFDEDDFRVQHRYDEVWVTSSFIADMYENKFGFERDKLKPIGYARTDILVNTKEVDKNELMRAYNIPVSNRKVVLYAATWKQDDSSRSQYPFNMREEEFLTELSHLAETYNCIFLIRSHLNDSATSMGKFGNVFPVSAACYPDTERLLLLCDLLIYDWSSIAFDYLLLGKGAIYLDVSPPFKKGFSLDGSYRYGDRASDLNELRSGIAKNIGGSAESVAVTRGCRERILGLVYEGFADGAASARACDNLVENYIRHYHE